MTGAGVDSSASSARLADRLSSMRSTTAPGSAPTPGFNAAELAAAVLATAWLAAGNVGATATVTAGATVAVMSGAPGCIQTHASTPKATSMPSTPIQSRRPDVGRAMEGFFPVSWVPGPACDRGAVGVPIAAGLCTGWRLSRSRSILLMTLTTCSWRAYASQSPSRVAGARPVAYATAASTKAGWAPRPVCPVQPGGRGSH